MQVSAKAEYACIAMLELATRHGDPRPVRLVDIAESHGIPQRFLVQILLQLKGAGLILSTRGASGGYQLARPPEEISLADVLGVVDRIEPPSAPSDSSGLATALHGIWTMIHQNRVQALKSISLANLVEAGQGLQYVI
ncbi:MAG: Rrf2 family transcriptional regulator [Bacteroidales bacterium]|nr:Rrf2 family transcriptional regulator [Bacteroidales bacterium]